MTLIEQIKEAIQAEKIPPIFKRSDFINIGIEDKNYNLSNYLKTNKGSQNTHTTVLVSTIIENETYYTFDEQLFGLDEK